MEFFSDWKKQCRIKNMELRPCVLQSELKQHQKQNSLLKDLHNVTVSLSETKQNNRSLEFYSTDNIWLYEQTQKRSHTHQEKKENPFNAELSQNRTKI